MATWGDFIQDVKVRKMNPGGMMVSVDDAIELWEERRKLREEVAQLREELEHVKSSNGSVAPLSDTKLKNASVDVRETCAREIEEFADACAAEDAGEMAVGVLRACAQMIRDRALEQVAEAEVMPDEEVPMAEPVHEEEPPQ